MNLSAFKTYAFFFLLIFSTHASANFFRDCRDSLGDLGRMIAYIQATHRADTEMQMARKNYEKKLRASASASNPYLKVLHQIALNRHAILEHDEDSGFTNGRELVRQISQGKLDPATLQANQKDLALHSYIRDILENRYQSIAKNMEKRKLEILLAHIELRKKEINFYRTIDLGIRHIHLPAETVIQRQARITRAEKSLAELLKEEKQQTKRVQSAQSLVRIQAQRLEAISELWPEAQQARLFYSHRFDPYKQVAGKSVFTHAPQAPGSP